MQGCGDGGTPMCRVCVRDTRSTWVSVCRNRKVPIPQKSCPTVPPLLLGSRSKAAHSRSREAEPEKVCSPFFGSGLALDTRRPPPPLFLVTGWDVNQGKECRGLRGLSEGIILLFKKLK